MSIVSYIDHFDLLKPFKGVRVFFEFELVEIITGRKMLKPSFLQTDIRQNGGKMFGKASKLHIFQSHFEGRKFNTFVHALSTISYRSYFKPSENIICQLISSYCKVWSQQRLWIMYVSLVQ